MKGKQLQCIIGLCLFCVLSYWLLGRKMSENTSDANLSTMQGVHIINDRRMHDSFEDEEKNREAEEANLNKHKIIKLEKIIRSMKLEAEEIKQTRSKQNIYSQIDIEKHQHKIKFLQEQLVKNSKHTVVRDIALKQLEQRIANISEINDNLSKENKHQKENKDTKPYLGMKLVHFDLKGAPPKIDYLIKIMKYSKKFGAGGFLIEYEDMFPWDEELSFLKCNNGYTKDDIRVILKTAADEKMIVIPLIQTFGHLEFVLKHKELKHLRADKEITNTICPINNGSVPLIKKMITQLLKMHPSSKMVHLGGDEVWNLKTCEKCRSSNMSDFSLYIHHMVPLFDFIKTRRTVNGKKVKPIIWDDMMRRWEVDRLKMMAGHVTPMVWAYVADLGNYHHFPPGIWERYSVAFSEIWIASSFKGALKPWSNFPPIKQHLTNHLSWLKIVNTIEKAGCKVIGIALTGWSRFDHYGPLCELLPAGIPSLALCLAVLQKGEFNTKIHQHVSERLKFEKPFQIDIPSFANYKPEKAGYPGGEYYKLAGSLEKAIGWNDWSNVRKTGWTRPYQKKKDFISFYQLNTTLYGLQKSMAIMNEVKNNASRILNPMFNKDIVEEWIEDKVDYHMKLIRITIADIKEMIKDFVFN